MGLTELNDRVKRIRSIVSECNDFAEKLEQAFRSAEEVLPSAELEAYQERVAAMATRPTG